MNQNLALVQGPFKTLSSTYSLPLVLALGVAGLLVAFGTAGCGTAASVLATSARNPNGLGPAPVSLSSSGSTATAGDLGASGNYVILSQTGITNVTGSAVTGNMGVSPAAASYITGFGTLPLDPTTQFSTSPQVIGGGRVYAADYTSPTSTSLTTAIGSMQAAYTDAASRTAPDFNELGTGNIGGLTLTPGLYTWTTNITIPTNVTIAGGATDIWIFQTTGSISEAAAMTVTLSGGAQAKNIFWQVAGQVTIGTSAHFEGIILAKTAITFQTTASLNGRALSQTQVVLDNNAITQP